MRADVAVADRAEQCVRDRVQRDIGVGMSGKSLRMGNFHAAEPEAVARGESMDVESLTDPDIAGLVHQPRFGLGKVAQGR